MLADLIEFWTVLHDERYWTSAGFSDDGRLEADFGPESATQLRGYRF